MEKLGKLRKTLGTRLFEKKPKKTVYKKRMKKFKPKHIGTKVEVYKNLHKTNRTRFATYSIRSCETGKVIGHAHEVHLKNVSLVVQEAGRKKVVETGVKNVHAFLKGELLDPTAAGLELGSEWVRVFYNPKQDKYFITERHIRDYIFKAEFAILNKNGAHVKGPL